MKASKKLVLTIGVGAMLFLGGCTKKFDAINTDPTQASGSNFDPNLLLPTAQVNYMQAIQGYNGALLFQSMWIQTFASASYPSYYSNGDKYVASGNILTYDQSLWNVAYQSASYAYEAQQLSAGVAADANLSGVSLILELMNIQNITDSYGDVPFTQGLQAKSGVTQPVYDKQSVLYPTMLSKLDSVLATLDVSGKALTNDAFSTAGSIAKWKKLGYSVMLKMAMRLTKVDAATAKTYAEKAYAGGLIASNDDNVYLTFDNGDGYSNSNSSALVVAQDYLEVKWGKVLIDYLKSTNDPRLPVISEVPAAGTANAKIETLAGDTTFANQQGMPNGYDQNGGATDISHATGYPGSSGTGDDVNPTGLYSRPKTSLYLSLDAPGFVMTYAQVELLLAEAAVRGWSVGSSAAVHYSNAITNGLLTYGTINGTTPISAGDAATYATAHPLDVSSTDASLEQINTQYWVLEGTLFDFNEAWNNWKRSGYPVLTPVSYTGNFTSGTIPRRQAYPSGEATTNPANYKTAVNGITGGDLYTGRVWWDAQ